MIIDCIADLHGCKPILPGGDLLIIAGDLTANDTEKQHAEFAYWLEEQDYSKKIVIAGNHDSLIQGVSLQWAEKMFPGATYLQDTGTEFQGLKIWGTPWTPIFDGVNPRCTAFMETESFLDTRFSLIPEYTDILITHGPMRHMLDANKDGYACGSISLRKHIDRVKPLFHIFGHIHEQGGQQLMYKHQGPNTWCVNCSYVDERYRPIFNHIRITI